MSLRAVEVDTAYKWHCPLHIWDGTGDHPNEDQKAEMVAYCKCRGDMEAWEADVQARQMEGKSSTVRIG